MSTGAKAEDSEVVITEVRVEKRKDSPSGIASRLRGRAGGRLSSEPLLKKRKASGRRVEGEFFLFYYTCIYIYTLLELTLHSLYPCRRTVIRG